MPAADHGGVAGMHAIFSTLLMSVGLTCTHPSATRAFVS
jgi:hypothetical protein